MPPRKHTPAACWRVTFRATYFGTQVKMLWSPVIAADSSEDAIVRLHETFMPRIAADIEVISVRWLHAGTIHGDDLKILRAEGAS